MEFILKEVEYGSVSCVQIYTANFIRIMSPSDFVKIDVFTLPGFFFFFFGSVYLHSWTTPAAKFVLRN